MLERLLFSDFAPWVALSFAVVSGVSAAWASSRKKKGLRNLGLGMAVAGLLGAGVSRYGLYLYPVGGSEDTRAMAMENGVLVVADRRTIRELLPNVDLDPKRDDVLRLHVLDSSDGTLRCRAVAGLQARLLDVVGGQAWIAASGYGADVRWSYRTIRRMSVQDCTLEDVLERGWKEDLAGLDVGVARIDYVGDGTMIMVGNDGTAHRFHVPTQERQTLEPEEMEAYRDMESAVSRPGGGAASGVFATRPSGGGASFLEVGRLSDDGRGWRSISERVYVEPMFIAHSSEEHRTLLAHRDGERGPLLLTALDDDGGHAWDIGEKAAFGRSISEAPGNTPLAVADEAGFIVAHGGEVVKIDWGGQVLWHRSL